MIKSKFITSIFQEYLNNKDKKYLNNKDISTLKNNLFYYFIFRAVRSFLVNDIILNISNFRIYGSINKNKTSYFLLKKCEFGDYHELNIINKFAKKIRSCF